MQSAPAKSPAFSPLQIDIKSFLNEAAVVQTSMDSFQLFLGPFTPAPSDLRNKKLLYKPDFWDFLDPKNKQMNLLQADQVIEINRTEFFELLLGETATQKMPEIKWQIPDKPSFQNQFLWVADKIKKNELAKGLPITLQTGQGFSSDAKVQVLKNILEKRSEQYLYGFWNSNSGFIGFTPEILIQKNENQTGTMALAGTWNKLSNPKPNFQDSKIRNEHQIVIDDVLNQLKNEKLISQTETAALELEYLVHLKTEFLFENSDTEKFIHQLHPTAALGLYPRSQKLFSEFQNFELQNQRKNFGAPFGFVSARQSFLIVAIRNIFWSNDKISIYSGCGVTGASDFEIEWQELEAKRNSVKKTFGLNL